MTKDCGSGLLPDEEVPVIIQTKDLKLQHLPWHLWHFFEDYRYSEAVLSSIGDRTEKSILPRTQMRILIILGNSSGIDVEADRRVMENLPGAETVFLVEPTRQQLHQFLWDEQGWDILCFSGHSSSHADGSAGVLQLNQTVQLTLGELKHSSENSH